MPHSSACAHWRRSKALAEIPSTGIVTLTINPAVDVSTSVKKMVPFTKMRCAQAHRDPGGGGINVARVLKRLGIEASAIYPAGGATGQLLGTLVEREGVRSVADPGAERDAGGPDDFRRDHPRAISPGLPGSAAQRSRMAGMPGHRSRASSRRRPSSSPAAACLPAYRMISTAESRRLRKAHSKVIVDTSGPFLKAALRTGRLSDQAQPSRVSGTGRNRRLRRCRADRGRDGA